MTTKKNNKQMEILDLNEGNLSSSKKKNNSKKKKKKTSINREFAVVTYIFFGMFMLLIGYFVYFMQVKSETFINSSYNTRLNSMSKYYVRGDILTADGVVIATSETNELGEETRVYPYKNLYSHTVGYTKNGMSGVELDSNFDLQRSHVFFLDQIVEQIQGYKVQGDSVVTTLDSNLQQTVYDGMNYKGAVVVLEPSTGKILSMVSKPDFDPNTIADDWNFLVESSSSVLMNRATQGLYPPGSTFKMLTALEYFNEKGYGMEDYYNCNSSYSAGDYTIHCYHNSSHGRQNFVQAFGNSCNAVFAQVGLALDPNAYTKTCESLYFNKALPTRLSNVKKSSFYLDDSTPVELVMQTAIGQGDTLVTPLHMAMIASCICNNGEMMEPYIIDKTQNADDITVEQYESKSLGKLLSDDQAMFMSSIMRYVVTDGTGKKLQSDTYEAYGKTGTAEHSSDKNNTHSWFVGYAKQGDKEVAVAIILEQAGSGSTHAVPLARKIFDAYFGM